LLAPFSRRGASHWRSLWPAVPRSGLVSCAVVLVVLAVVAGAAGAAIGVGVKITARPKPLSVSSSAVFRWRTSGKVLRTLCSIDRHRFVPCKRSKRYTGLRDGLHSFRVEAVGSRTTRRIASAKWRSDTTPPSLPVASGGSAAWQRLASVTIRASGSTDAGSGLASYEARTSTDGGGTWGAPVTAGQVAVGVVGETLVEFRAVDHAGNRSAWAPGPGNAGATVRIDRDAPLPPTVSGGSSQWQNAPVEDVIGSGSVDVGGAGIGHYEHRTSTDGGTTWSAPSVGADASITADGETLVQFRAVDGAGNASAWAPPAPVDGSTVRLDRTIPTSPAVTGATSDWQNAASLNLTASGSTDAQGAGVAYYESRTSTDGGASWSAPLSGSTIAVSAEGETLVEFRAVDNASLDSAWTLAPVRLDRTNPTDPTVSGGSPAWQSVGVMRISASGSTDAGGSGLAGYQYRQSTDGGVTWSTPTDGSAASVTTEGETLVQMRAVDGAGNVSGWVQGTARIDRTLPTAPLVSGGSLSWQSVASVDVSASGSTDAGGSTFVGYEYRTSTDGGTTWATPSAGPTATISPQGTTLVQFRAVDAAGNASPWAPATPGAGNTVRLDHTAPTISSVSGGSLSWQTAQSVTVTAGGSADTGGSGFLHDQYRTSTDGGATWSNPASGASVTISVQGETMVQFQALDSAGNTSPWIPATPGAADTIRLDRTAPTAPTVSGGSANWQSVASMTLAASGSTDIGSGLAGYQYRTSTDAGVSWSAVTSGPSITISAQGATLVEFRAVDGVNKTSSWVQADARIDRTAPAPPALTGGSPAWQSTASIAILAAPSSDTGGSGFAGDTYRTSTDGGTTWSPPTAGSSLTVAAEGETLVQFQSIDRAGNASAWVQATARIDRTAPTAPTVTGGSSAWQSAPSVAITGSGSTDSGGSGLGYQYRTSTSAGVTWSTAVSGASDQISAEGTTLVQFRSIDGAGNTSAWTPTSPTAGSTVKLDNTPPTPPTVVGGSSTWQSVASITINASASSDALSGFAGYDYRTSTDGGTTWSAPMAASADTITAEGTTLVQFRARDNAGNATAWTPTGPTLASTARIDRTAPTAPSSVTGGSLAWQTAPSVTITAAGASDATSGLRGYNVRTSTNGGITWSASTPISGPTFPVTAEGTTLVEFQAVDNAGNISPWTPASPGAANTVMLDRTPPTLPTITGGQGAGTCKHRLTVSATGSTDALSGFAHYDYRVSINGGSTWTATVTNASSVTLTAKGTYIVQFHADDLAGNISAWAPAITGNSNTACIR
jgi:large repetitive protein